MKFVAALTWLLCTLCECSRDGLEDAEYIRHPSEEAHPPQIWRNGEYITLRSESMGRNDNTRRVTSITITLIHGDDEDNENGGAQETDNRVIEEPPDHPHDPNWRTTDGPASSRAGENDVMHDNLPNEDEEDHPIQENIIQEEPPDPADTLLGHSIELFGGGFADWESPDTTTEPIPEDSEDVPFGTLPYTWPEGHTPFISLESHAQSNVQDLVPGQNDQPAETGQTTPNSGTDGGANNGTDGGSLPLLADFIGVVISGISENTQVQIVTQGGETSSEETSIPSSASSTTIILDISNPSEVDILKGEQNGMYERVFTPMGDRRITSIRDSNMVIWSAEVYESCQLVKHYRKDGRELLSLEIARLGETQRRCFVKNGEWMSITERDFMNQLQLMRNGDPGDDPDEGTSNLRGAMTTPFEGTSSVSDVETPSTGDGESVETSSEDSQATVHPEELTESLENVQPEDHPSETTQETAPSQAQSTFQAT